MFVDLTKIFDTVNRDVLWIILDKLQCQPEFVKMFQELYSNMKSRHNYKRTLSVPFTVDDCVKKDDIPATTVFIIYCAVTIVGDFQNCFRSNFSGF